MQPSEAALAKRLDAQLQRLNGDYMAKRTANLALDMPTVRLVPSGTFDAWLEGNQRLGEQHKVPRLTHDEATFRAVLDASKQELSPTC